MLALLPGGLEKYFAKAAGILKDGQVALESEQEIAGHYGQEFLDGLVQWGQ